MTMHEIFAVFAQIVNKYLELTQDPDTTPCLRFWAAVDTVAREYGFVLLSEPQYDYMVKRSKESAQ